jgi:hypothetical protein
MILFIIIHGFPRIAYSNMIFMILSPTEENFLSFGSTFFPCICRYLMLEYRISPRYARHVQAPPTNGGYICSKYLIDALSIL